MAIESPRAEGAVLYVAGATATRPALATIEATLQTAYADVAVIESSALAGPPTREKYGVIADTIARHSEGGLHALIHSAGGEDFRKGLQLHRQRDPRGKIDMRGMTVVPIEVMPGISTSVRAIPHLIGPEAGALDSAVAFPIGGLDTDQSLQVRRDAFHERAQNGTGLKALAYDDSTHHWGLVPDGKKGQLADLDGLLQEARLRGDNGRVRELLLRRGVLLTEQIEAIYKGARIEGDEAAGKWTGRAVGQAVGVALGSISGRAWRMLEELRDMPDGPDIRMVVPEFGVVPRSRAEAFYVSPDVAAQQILFMPGHTHASLALQTGVLLDVKRQVDATPRNR